MSHPTGSSTTNEITEVEDQDATSPSQKSPMRRIAEELWKLHAFRATGELAALRRMDRRSTPPAAFHRLMVRVGFTEMSHESLIRWARIVGIMAQRPDALRASGLGKAMADAGFSEARLDMLLNAQGSALHDLARRTAIRIARTHDTLPYADLGKLLLYDGRPDDRDKADAVRITIAQSYLHAKNKRDKPGD